MYLKNIESGKPVKLNQDLLSNTDRINETIGFGLRMSTGISLKKVPEKYRSILKRKLTLAEKKFKECLINKGHNVQLTRKGILFADEITVELLF